MECAVKRVTVYSVLRRLVAVMAIGVLLTPTAAGLCASPSRHCEAAQHGCCDGPRLAQCDCGDRHGSEDQSEPAHRSATLKAGDTLVALALEIDRPRPAALSPVAWTDASPPRAISERLSLLSTLLI